MNCHHYSATVLLAIVVGVIASTYAQAGSRVGDATDVVRDVSGALSGQSWVKKVQGDDVYENEFIRTEAGSSARISFIDETDIRIGPAATMKIDRVVFKSNRSVSELIVTAEEGAMRWNSGVSLSSAYQVKTATAIIKVHGTTFDLLAEPQQTTVVLRRGTIEVCSIDPPQRCQILSRSGDTIIATPNNLERPQRAGPGPSEFAERCLSSNMMAPCVIMASVQPTKSGSVTSPTTGRGTPPTTGIVTLPATGIVPPPTGSVETPYVPSGPPVVDRTQSGPGVEQLPVGCYRDRGRLKCQSPMPSGPTNAGNSSGGTHSGSSDGVSRKSPTPAKIHETRDSPRRVGDSKLAYVKPSSPKQTYVKPTVRQTYVRPIVRPTYVRPAPQRPTPMRSFRPM